MDFKPNTLLFALVLATATMSFAFPLFASAIPTKNDLAKAQSVLLSSTVCQRERLVEWTSSPTSILSLLSMQKQDKPDNPDKLTMPYQPDKVKTTLTSLTMVTSPVPDNIERLTKQTRLTYQ